MNKNVKIHNFPNGLTVAQLKNIIKTWPEFNVDTNEECEVWMTTGNMLSSPVTEICPLNKRDEENASDILFDANIEYPKNNSSLIKQLINIKLTSLKETESAYYQNNDLQQATKYQFAINQIEEILRFLESEK